MKRAIIILLALIIDLALGDPPNRFHPVVLMGNWLKQGRVLAPPRRRFWFGLGWIVAGTALFALPFWKVERKTKAESKAKERTNSQRDKGKRQLTLFSVIHHSSFILHPFFLKPVFAYRNLRRSVADVANALAVNDLPQARQLTAWHLVSRDTSRLTTEEVAGAAIESLAENVTDSVTAPLMAYALGGLPPAWAYRFINTADAMWGYRTNEFEQLGKFPARLDDALNWLPARLTGWLLVVAARLAGEDAGQSARVMLEQHSQTSSPNAGWTMGAVAGALGITLSKHGVYQLAGGHKQPDVTVINRALRLADICVGLSVLLIWSSLLIIENGCKK